MGGFPKPRPKGRKIIRLARASLRPKADAAMHQHFLRADLKEIRPFRFPVRQNPRGLAAACFARMRLDQAFQLRLPMRWLTAQVTRLSRFMKSSAVPVGS